MSKLNTYARHEVNEYDKLRAKLIGRSSIIDGAMIGDGNLHAPRMNACFRYGKANIDNVDLVGLIKCELESLGVSFASNMPRVLKDGSLWLASRVHPLLTLEHAKWYPSGIKEVPEDVLLDPVALAVWFMDDGSSTRSTSSFSVTTFLATHSFSNHSIEILENKLHLIGLNTGRSHDSRVKTGTGIYISILQESVDLLMDLIEPHILPSYKYKIKKRVVASRKVSKRRTF